MRASGAGVRNLKVAASATMPTEKREMSATDEFEESRPNSPRLDGVASLKREDSLTARSMHCQGRHGRMPGSTDWIRITRKQ